jgi:hypothetical protein
MDTQDMLAQYKLFVKYYNSADDNKNLKDYQTADKLREKLVPQIETFIEGNDNPQEIAAFFEVFTEFLFHYILCLDDNGKDSWHVQDEMKRMVEKAIELNPNSFGANYFLTIYHSFNLSTAHAGNIQAIHKGRGAAESIVGTAVNLLVKGVTLGATATAAGISRSTFTNSVRKLIEVYKSQLNQVPLPAIHYLKITSKMFDIAELCENAQNSIWREVYSAVKEYDVKKLDYSEVNDESIQEAKEQAMEFVILADSKI